MVDDRARVAPGDRVLLVVEDDPGFAQLLAELGRERGFKVVVATRGADALATARELRPDAITFDIGLPDLDGWRVLDRLKDDPATRHIPVFLISAADELERGLRSGAVGFLAKPAERGQLVAAFGRLREVVEQRRSGCWWSRTTRAAAARSSSSSATATSRSTAVASASEALALLSAQRFDCMVLSTLGDYGPVLALLRKLEASRSCARSR